VGVGAFAQQQSAAQGASSDWGIVQTRWHLDRDNKQYDVGSTPKPYTHSTEASRSWVKPNVFPPIPGGRITARGLVQEPRLQEYRVL